MNIIVLWVFIALQGCHQILTESIKACLKDSDCSSNTACMQGFCKSPCREVCGATAICVLMKHKPYCFCAEDNDDCLPRKVSRTCVPECEKNSVCNTDIGYCECKKDYQGNPYKGCMKKCKTASDCPLEEICVDGGCKSPCEEDCGINSLCVVKDHTSVCYCPPGFTGNSFEICRPIADVPLLTKTDICQQCVENSKCYTANGETNCACLRGFVGNPFVSCDKMCLSNSDCPSDKVCVNHVCADPCEGACGVNADCEVDIYRRKPICTCGEGFTGDPSRICTIKLETRFGDTEDEYDCHPVCGANATCNTKHGICTCNTGFTGNPYGGCRKKCETNSECPDDKACFDEDCKDPCLDACGRNALCRVDRHTPLCRCPYGFNGDPSQICRKLVSAVTKPTIVEVDLCDSFTCGTNAACRIKNTEPTCSCLRGYIGNPYMECLKECQTNLDCSDEDRCINGTCINSCKGSCGINALCRVKRHTPICSCPDKYKGDSLKICFPKAEGVLVNPSRVPCLKCICRAITGNEDIFACAEKSISFGYWAFAGEDLVGGEDFRTKNSTIDFITCMHNRICILNTMNDYISRALHRLNDIDCDGQITCADYFAVHKFGLTAKFSDSLFNASEARSFDQCEDHGEKDITNNWAPKKCTGPSYVDLLS